MPTERGRAIYSQNQRSWLLLVASSINFTDPGSAIAALLHGRTIVHDVPEVQNTLARGKLSD
jgi:precorrin isomerase